MLRLRRARKHVHHTITRFIQANHKLLLRRTIDTQALGSRVA